MPSIQETLQIQIIGTRPYAQDTDGLSRPIDPPPTLLRVHFVPTARDVLQELPIAYSYLTNTFLPLIAITSESSSERQGILFEYTLGKSVIVDGKGTRDAHIFESAKWPKFARQDEWGYFVSGTTETSLLRIVRTEPDHAKRTRLGLQCVRLPSGLPQADFSAIDEQALRIEIERNWDGLHRLIGERHYREAVTAAKNVLEALLTHLLARANLPSGGTLYDKLKRVRKQLDNSQPTPPAALSEMEYHLAQKIRLLHKRTHPEKAAKLERETRPEFELTSVEDLVEILSALGFIRK